jgi:hypothetical protein
MNNLYPRISSRTARAGHAAGKESSVIGFKGTQAGVEEVALGDDDYVKSIRDLVPTKNLSNQTFRSISLDGATEFLRGGDSQPANAAVCQHEHSAIPAVNSKPTVVDLLELRAAANVFGWPESQIYSLLTVRRLRPFARRLFSTRRPFLVLIRTRNPCVRLRCRVLG